MAKKATPKRTKPKRPNRRKLDAILDTNPDVVGYSAVFQPEEVRGKLSGRMAIRVYVKKKIPKRRLPPNRRLPEEIDGIPVDVFAIGTPTDVQLPHTPPSGGVPDPAAHRLKYVPMIGGITVGPRLGGETGTLGYFLVGPPSTPTQNPACNWYILSCAHVLEPNIAGGREVIQPGTADGGSYPGDGVGIETAFTYDNLDAAIAQIDEGARGAILDLVRPVGTADPQRDMVVSKSGRTTGVTTGVIIDANFTTNARRGPGKYFTGVMLIRNGIAGQPFVAEGDSGSLIIDILRQRAVGLLFRGTEELAPLTSPPWPPPSGERSFEVGLAFPIKRVLRAFPNLRFVRPDSQYPAPDPCTGGFV